MEIFFLGTGGGRFNLISQTRRTGGFLIKGSIQLHIDPGPGALIACKDFGQDSSKTDVVVVTHKHIDHLNDAALMLESINPFPSKKKGALIASKSVLIEDEYGEKGISSYFINKLSWSKVAYPEEEIAIESKCGASLLPTPVEHEDKTGFGFVLSMDGKKIGYTSDTEYLPSHPSYFSGCDVLVANNLKPKKDQIRGHLSSPDVALLLSQCSPPPRLCLLSHLGMSLLKAGPDNIAKQIEKESGVKTIAASDGMLVDVSSLQARAWNDKGKAAIGRCKA